MIIALFTVPLFAGLLAFAVKNKTFLRCGLILTAGIHLSLVIACWFVKPAGFFYDWFVLDSLGLLFLSVASLLFFMAAIYLVGEFRRHDTAAASHGSAQQEGSESIFVGCLLLALSTMTLVNVSHHFGLLWVAMEATTLATAPLISFYRGSHALEATWKYLLLCSIGIALSLLGNIFLGLSAVGLGAQEPLLLKTWLTQITAPNSQWMKVAFIFYLVGYGTKMGLAPLHTWLPDAHSEAPSAVSALLSGTLLNCAFLALLRVQQVYVAQGMAGFTRELFTIFGIASLAVASFFILGQKDYKRLLAYSSIEHMGILALSVGLGGVALTGGLLHVLNHSLIKGLLFMTAGNVLAYYKTKEISKVSGMLKASPLTGILWFAGFLAITGTPPFGLFLSKFLILKGALEQGQFIISIVFLAILAIIFIGMGSSWVHMTQGTPTGGLAGTQKAGLLNLLPAALLCLFALLLGLYIPPFLNQAIQSAAGLLGGA